MELIYAILIFFGAMTPNEYSAQTNTAFNPGAMQQTVQNNQALIERIASNPNLAERIRTMDIDRLED